MIPEQRKEDIRRMVEKFAADSISTTFLDARNLAADELDLTDDEEIWAMDNLDWKIYRLDEQP